MTKYQHFHSGEVQLQREWGTDTDAFEAQSHQMMLPDINPNEQTFIDGLTFSMAGSVDDQGRPWASPLLQTGAELFQVEHARRVRIAAQHSVGDDPLLDNVAATGQVSVVFIKPATRRRAKSIGAASLRSDGGIDYDLTRIFGICPKYIYKRDHVAATGPSLADASSLDVGSRTVALSELDQTQLRTSDTVFFASHSPHGADVTHRGGQAGFITVIDDHTLDIPDYLGNGMFNTLGNLVLDDRLAITDMDFATGRTIHMTGRAQVRKNDQLVDNPPRVVRFTIEEVRTSAAPAGEWTDIEASRYNPAVV